MAAIYPPSNASLRPITLAAGNTVVRAGSGVMYGYSFVNTAAGAAATATIYDNTTATGTKILARVDIAATGGTTGIVEFPNPVAFTTGISVAITGGNLLVAWVLVD